MYEKYKIPVVIFYVANRVLEEEVAFFITTDTHNSRNAFIRNSNRVGGRDRNMPISRKTLALVAVVIVVLIVAGVGALLLMPKPKEAEIVIGTTDVVKHLDPAMAYDFMSCNVIYNVFDTLVRIKRGTTEIEPGLAESWEISEDGKVITFHLRRGVKFHDGTELDAEVVKFSIERVIRLGGDPSWIVSEFVEKVEVVDKYTVRFYLKQAFAPFLSVVAFTAYAPVSPKAVEELGDEGFDKSPVGTGPFKVVEWREGEYVILERFDDYWDKSRLPKVKRVIIRFFKDATSLRMAIEGGEIDIAFRHLNVEDIEELKKKAGIVVLEGPSLMIRYLVFNVGNFTEMKDARVRKAIAYAIDRDRIVNEVFKGAAVKIYSLVNPGLWAYKPVFKKYDLPREEALAKARELLRAAGYSEDNKLKLTLWYTTDHYGPKEADVAQVIKEALEETGLIEVELRGLPWSDFLDRLDQNVMMCFLLGWYPDYIDPDNYLYPFLHSSSSGPVFSCWYSSPEVDELLVRARKTPDIAERSSIYAKIQEVLGEDVPFVPLWSEKQYIIFRDYVKGVTLEPTMILWFDTLEKPAGE